MDKYFRDNQTLIVNNLLKKTPKEIAEFLGMDTTESTESAICQFVTQLETVTMVNNKIRKKQNDIIKKEPLGYEKTIREMSNNVLLSTFSSYNLQALEYLRKDHNYLLGNGQEPKEFPTMIKDFITMYLIEILRRMGNSVDAIKITIKEYPLLNYKNGEEEYFLIEEIADDFKFNNEVIK